MAHQLLLKAIKYSEWASQETACYQAKLYVDGKSFAYVSNEGHGGPDRVDRDPKYKGNWSEVMREVTEGFNDETRFPREAPCELFPDGWGENLETWCGKRLDEHLARKDMKRAMKKKCLFLFENEEGVYQSDWHPPVTNGDWTKLPNQKVRRKILNDMPEEIALMYYMGKIPVNGATS